MLKKALRTAGNALKERAFPGGQMAILRNGETDSIYFGRLSYDRDSAPVDPNVLYDLASVTKIVSTTAQIMLLVQSGMLRLETELGEIISGFDDDILARATVRQLLSHSSGLPAWRPLYRAIPVEEIAAGSGKSRALELLKRIRTDYAPGTSALYSDLDFMILGFIIERLTGDSLDSLAQRNVFRPLGMENVAFHPKEAFPDRTCAPTENCPWRGRVLVGEVDDENTFAAGCVAGQAGLFASAAALLPFCREMLDALDGKGKIFSQETIHEFTARAFPESDFSFCLGFDGRSPHGSRLPESFGPRTFGHWGFTGTGLWIEPEKMVTVVLLTNRVHPSRENDRLNVWRPLLFNAAMRFQSEP